MSKSIIHFSSSCIMIGWIQKIYIRVYITKKNLPSLFYLQLLKRRFVSGEYNQMSDGASH